MSERNDFTRSRSLVRLLAVSELILHTLPAARIQIDGYVFFPSRSAKKLYPNSSLESLNLSFLSILSIFFKSADSSLKSPSMFAFIRDGVFDFGSTEWPWLIPQANATWAPVLLYFFPISTRVGSSYNGQSYQQC